MSTESHSAIEPLAPEWDELADRAGAMPWLRPGWVIAWRQAFGEGEARVLTLRKDGRLAAVLPMQRRLGELTSPSNWHTPAFGVLAEDQGAGEELLRGLFSLRVRRVTASMLSRREVDALGWERAARATGHRLRRRTLEHSPYVAIAGDWGAYERGLSSKFLSDLRRCRRRLEAEGRVSFTVEDGRDRLDELLEEGFAIEAAGWKGSQGTAIRSDPATHEFYRRVARWSAERGWLRLAFLRLDGRGLAFDYCLEDAGAHHLVKTGFDPAFRKFAPGMLLRQEMLQRAFSAGLASYDLGGADEPWKMRWTDTTRELVRLRTFAPSALGRLDWIAHAVGPPLVRQVGRAAQAVRPRREPSDGYVAERPGGAPGPGLAPAASSFAASA